MLDAQLTMRDHISRTAQAGFFIYVDRLRSVRYSLGCDVTFQLVVALVFSHLNYCNAVDFLAFTYRFYSQTVLVLLSFSVPDIVMRRRSICRRRTKSIVVIVIVTLGLLGVFVHLPLTLYLSVRRGFSLSVIGRFRLRLPNFGMNFPATSPLPSLWRLSVVSLKICCFVYHIRFYNLYC